MMKRLLILLMTVVAYEAVNHSVYKVLLSQKGYTQFLQYDIEIPDLQEFTLCAWIKLYNLDNDQTIFTYNLNGNRIIWLRMTSPDRIMKLSIAGKTVSSVAVTFPGNSWSHVCLTYQSASGSWGIYVDGNFVECQASDVLSGIVIPGGGNLIIGYGTDENGLPSGLNGEIYGVNMLLKSTIQNRNSGFIMDHTNAVRPFNKNKLRPGLDRMKYTVFRDLPKKTRVNIKSNTSKKTQSNHRPIITTPASEEFIFTSDMSDGKKIFTEKNHEEKEIYDFVSREKEADSHADRSPIQFWNLVNKAGLEGKFKDNLIVPRISGSSTNEFPTISVYETPPPPSPSALYTTEQNNMEMSKPVTISHFERLFSMARMTDKTTTENLAVETPPPPQKNSEVYGQWTGKKFSHNALSYLKSIKFGNREPPKIPATIPLAKISDSLPYASSFSVRKKVVPLTFPRNNFKIIKRSIKEPAINVQILEDDWKETIRKHHASTRPMKVEITNRGINEKSWWHRYNRDTKVPRTKKNKKKTRKRTNMTKGVNAKRNAKISTKHGLETTKFGSILPFLKSLEYFIVGNETSDAKKETQTHNHKWHNIKSFNDNHQAREINMSMIQYIPTIQNNNQQSLNLQNLSTKKPALRKHKKRKFKNRHRNKSNKTTTTHKLTSSTTTANTLRSNDNDFSTYLTDSLPKGASTSERIIIKPIKSVGFSNRTIKIGNALNELPVLGLNDVNKKNSFLGGVEKVPDIDRYRSDSEEKKPEYVPPSLTSTVCKATEVQHERLLSNLQDSGTLMYKGVNLAFEFIIMTHKQCAIDNSTPNKIIDLLLIDWDITPVNLFGGAYPVKTIDLCGFF